MKISSLDDIQKLEAKDLREILKYNLKSTGWIRADLVLKVYALLMRDVLPLSSGENRELLTDVQDLQQNQSDFRYEVTMIRIQLLDGRVISVIYLRWISVSFMITRCFTRIRQIVLRGTHYRKYHRSCSGWLRKRGNRWWGETGVICKGKKIFK